LHAYALDPSMPDDAVRAHLIDDLHAIYPETQRVTILEERFRKREDCPAFPPGGHDRPTVDSGVPGVYLAGDFIRLPFPSALMERAAASGVMAANAVLAAHGLRAEPVWSVPPRGLLR